MKRDGLIWPSSANWTLTTTRIPACHKATFTQDSSLTTVKLKILILAFSLQLSSPTSLINLDAYNPGVTWLSNLPILL